MKIKDIYQKYGGQIDAYTRKISKLREEQAELKTQMEENPDQAKDLKKNYDRLELSVNLLSTKRQEYQDFTAKVAEQENLIHNAVVARQQAEAMSEEAEDMSKCMEVASRIARGDSVPAKDLQKLMQKYPDLYKMAMAQRMMGKTTGKKHKSMWEDEDGKKTQEASASEQASNTEIGSEGPEVVDVETTLAQGMDDGAGDSSAGSGGTAE